MIEKGKRYAFDKDLYEKDMRNTETEDTVNMSLAGWASEIHNVEFVATCEGMDVVGGYGVHPDWCKEVRE